MGKETTRFPFISLEKALDRAKALFNADPRGNSMLVPTAFEAWGYSPKSSGGHQTIAALIMYGLVNDEGSKENRRVSITRDCQNYFRDERDVEKQKYIKKFALAPRLLESLWGDWGASPPADPIARSHLKLDRGLNEQSARALLGIYKENVRFAELEEDDHPGEELYERNESSVSENEDRSHDDLSPEPPNSLQPDTKTNVEQSKTYSGLRERELSSGMLSKAASFRILVQGEVGVREIETLIRKLEIDKEIISD